MSPSDTERETMEIAALEIARLSEEIDGFRAELLAAQQARMELEAHLESFQDRAMEIEQEVREECYVEMEKKLQTELQRWKAVWAAEADRNDEHLDRKLEIYTRSIDCAEEDKENHHAGGNADLEAENERLRREVEMLRRDLSARSPSRSQRTPLRESRVRRETERGIMGDLGREMEKLSSSGDSVWKRDLPVGASPTKKVRKLTARKWDLMDEGELL